MPTSRRHIPPLVCGAGILALTAALAFSIMTPAYAEEAVQNDAAPLYTDVVEDTVTYEAVKGDTLLKIAGQFGVDLDYLVRHNPQKGKYLQVGQKFTVMKRSIIPARTADGIVINIPDRMLYLFRDGKLDARYPVGLGKPSWKTPRGEFKVVGKQKDPTWHVPPSIQREMKELGEEVKTEVPPGPDNPLGKWAVRTSIKGVLMHATIAPSSVYQFRSHGCIRMRSEDAEALFGKVGKGDTGSIVYEPVKLAKTRSGRVYLEVNRDAYGLAEEPLVMAAEAVLENGLFDRVDWKRIAEVAQMREGIAQDVTSGRTERANGQTEFSEGGAGTRTIAVSNRSLGPGDKPR